eukprot:scaffold58_cov79-Skeletonema_marinoi.AAC.7
MVIAAALERTVVTPARAARADPPATAANPAAIPGAASPLIRANNVAPTALAVPILIPRSNCSLDMSCCDEVGVSFGARAIRPPCELELGVVLTDAGAD